MNMELSFCGGQNSLVYWKMYVPLPLLFYYDILTFLTDLNILWSTEMEYRIRKMKPKSLDTLYLCFFTWIWWMTYDCRHPILSGIFQIHFSQNRFHFRAKDFHSYEIIGLKFQKKKIKSIPGQIQKLIFLYSVNLV